MPVSMMFFWDSASSSLWETNGTAAGTVPLFNYSNLPGASPYGFSPSDMTAFNGELYFWDSASNSLWETNGTAAGTFNVMPRRPQKQWLRAAGRSPSDVAPFSYPIGIGVWRVAMPCWAVSSAVRCAEPSVERSAADRRAAA